MPSKQPTGALGLQCGDFGAILGDDLDGNLGRLGIFLEPVSHISGLCQASLGDLFGHREGLEAA